ncbi:hypothetical protein [Streptomyces violaceusniger]|uniref:oxidoreductase n=1 Tax=Streptomyces violaceusniger TaxID=68280 RepID=UPI001386D925
MHPSSLAAPLAIGSIYDDRAIEPLARVAEAVHAEGAKLAIQLLHTGVRSALAFKQDTRFDPDAEWYSRAPSQIPLGETPGSTTPKAMDDAEIEEIITAFGTAAERAAAAGLDGVEFHLSHGYLPWQFLSPLYNHRDDAWGGDTERRLAFPVRCLDEIRQAVGQDRFVGYRINSTSFWPGDLETPDIVEVVAQPVPGWESGRTAGWDEVAEGTVAPQGRVVVVDDQSDAIAPLTAVLLAQRGADVALVTRWPMIGMETILDVCLEWIYPQLYAAGVAMVPDHFITAIDGDRVTLSLVHDHSGRTTRELGADWVVMATARRSQDALRAPLQARGISFEVIGDAVAPRGTYEAVYEGHRQGRKP